VQRCLKRNSFLCEHSELKHLLSCMLVISRAATVAASELAESTQSLMCRAASVSEVLTYDTVRFCTRLLSMRGYPLKIGSRALRRKTYGER
jgi:hypothetical protein